MTKAELRKDNERLRELLDEIRDWSTSYPTDVFGEPDLPACRAVLEANGHTLDAIGAHAMRHVLTNIVKMIDAVVAA